MRHVSAGKYKEAKHVLLGFNFSNPSNLTASEQETIKNHLRGPFASGTSYGMSEKDADETLKNMGWILSTPDKP